MKRNLESISNQKFDIIIIGGGIFGICAAWDASLRGLKVALFERGDFANAASANCFKIVHGGIRYLQHLDIKRIRESSIERNILLRIAPHLVKPLPIVIPTYGYGANSKAFLRVARFIYDLITFDKNRDINDSGRRLPAGSVMSRDECMELFPGLKSQGLSGAISFYDAQMYSPSRLALAYLKSAVQEGTEAANYTEVIGLLTNRDNVTGVKVHDLLSGENFDVQSKIVINAAGPWSEKFLVDRLGITIRPKLTYSRDAFFVVKKQLFKNYSIAIQCSSRDSDAILKRGNRHLFIVPWRNNSIIGVWHKFYNNPKDDVFITRGELCEYIDEINEAYPALSIKLSDVSRFNSGFVLFGKNSGDIDSYSYGKRSLLIDHKKTDNVDGLITLIGVRYTTSRREAEKAVDLVIRKLGKKPHSSRTSITPLSGGNISSFDEYLDDSVNDRDSNLSPGIINSLVHNYGTEYKIIQTYIKEDNMLSETLGNSFVTKAEVIHSVRHEMAYKLSDIVFRRTDLGTGEYPGSEAIKQCAEVASKELLWDSHKLRNEMNELNAQFPNFNY